MTTQETLNKLIDLQHKHNAAQNEFLFAADDFLVNKLKENGGVIHFNDLRVFHHQGVADCKSLELKEIAGGYTVYITLIFSTGKQTKTGYEVLGINSILKIIQKIKSMEDLKNKEENKIPEVLNELKGKLITPLAGFLYAFDCNFKEFRLEKGESYLVIDVSWHHKKNKIVGLSLVRAEICVYMVIDYNDYDWFCKLFEIK